MRLKSILLTLGVSLLLVLSGDADQDSNVQPTNLLSGRFHWTAGPPLVSPAIRARDPCVSIKDPSVIYFEGRHHLFATIRSKIRTHQIEYCSFASWTKPAPMFPRQPASVKTWLDFWVICDASKAHLFFTSLDGRMWRAETRLQDFPFAWNEPKVVLEADIFEAAHIYRLKDLGKYLALIEAQAGSRRYYKAFLSDSLEGVWKPLAATWTNPFAGLLNVRQTGPHWTDSFSHGELLRDAYDEKLEVDSEHLRFLFQGVSDQRREGKGYGEIPWQLGILERHSPD